jgi:hypothetical protein
MQVLQELSDRPERGLDARLYLRIPEGHDSEKRTKRYRVVRERIKERNNLRYAHRPAELRRLHITGVRRLLAGQGKPFGCQLHK